MRFDKPKEANNMREDEFEGKWMQVRGQAKVWWGKLTDEDMEEVGGQIDKIISLIQNKYGYTTEYAKQEFNQRMAEYEAAQNMGDLTPKN
jgi:uncharacterized protein YjbJ (UPF0337 family)